MLDIEIRSLKRKIQTAKNLLPIIETMLKHWHEWPVELYFEIKNRLLNGHVIAEPTYSKIVCASRSRTLYEARGYCYSMSSLHGLLEAGIPDRAIERQICKNVEKEFYASYSTYLSESLSSLASYGSVESLEVLEVIAYDSAPAHQVSKLKQSILIDVEAWATGDEDYWIHFEQLSAGLRVKYYNKLRDTIQKIKTRNAQLGDNFAPWSTI